MMIIKIDWVINKFEEINNKIVCGNDLIRIITQVIWNELYRYKSEIQEMIELKIKENC